jgi:hypothetical protein
MKVLVACEYSGIVRDAFLAKGHDAISCDLLPTESPGPHIQGDVIPLLQKYWDMVLAFPTCTHICVSGAKHFEKKRKDGRQQEGIDFFMHFANCKAEKVCIENPVGIMSSIWREPDQIIQPYYFGDEAQKTTCLWLKGLSPLIHYPRDTMFHKKTHVGKGDFVTTPSGKKLPKWYSDNKNPKDRAKFWPGIARAMAEQWG